MRLVLVMKSFALIRRMMKTVSLQRKRLGPDVLCKVTMAFGIFVCFPLPLGTGELSLWDCSAL